jgi:CheY-like chemotaxis protein
MLEPRRSLRLLVCDDDDDDRLLIQAALNETPFALQIDFVQDGEALMNYLYRRQDYHHLQDQALPSLILLDLNMPKKDGREALAEIKSSPVLRHLVVVVLTTSRQPEDIQRCYQLGVNSFIIKPAKFDTFVEKMRILTRYWFEVAELYPKS